MMILKDKEHVDSVDWLTVAEIIAAAGLNQRDVALVERAFRHSTFCWFGYENGQLIAVARAISDLTGAAIWQMSRCTRAVRERGTGSS